MKLKIAYFRIWPNNSKPRSYNELEDIKFDYTREEVANSVISLVINGVIINNLNSERIAEEL